jgi:hypothetical protein
MGGWLMVTGLSALGGYGSYRIMQAGLWDPVCQATQVPVGHGEGMTIGRWALPWSWQSCRMAAGGGLTS